MNLWDVCFPSNQEGYCYVLILGKEPERRWIDLKTQRHLFQKLIKVGQNKNVYFCPAVFKERTGKKEGVLGSWVSWIDLDRPHTFQEGEATAVVNSGTQDHSHVYWRSDRFLTRQEVESSNRHLTARYNADLSGVDACQLLRVPDTVNHKQGHKVTLATVVKKQFQLDVSPHKSEQHLSLQLEPIDLLLAQKPLPPKLRALFVEGRATHDRSSSLYYLAASLHEAGYTENQIYSLLDSADCRWGKFSERDDKALRLEELVTRATFKPVNVKSALTPVGWKSLRNQSAGVSWVVEGLLRERGLMYFTGPTSVGKSTAVMQLTAAIVLGMEHWAGFKIDNKSRQKVLYGSHEMDQDEVLYFTSHLEMILQDDDVAKLDEALHFLATGRSIYLDTQEGRDTYERLLRAGGYSGVVLDTLGASVSSSLQEETAVRPVVDWIDKVRQEYGVWFIILHHPRKAAPGQKGPANTDDLYGSRLLIDRANTAIHLDRTPVQDLLRLTSLKTRLAKSTDAVLVKRTESLWFAKVEQMPEITKPSTRKTKKEDDDSFEIDLDI